MAYLILKPVSAELTTFRDSNSRIKPTFPRAQADMSLNTCYSHLGNYQRARVVQFYLNSHARGCMEFDTPYQRALFHIICVSVYKLGFFFCSTPGHTHSLLVQMKEINTLYVC